MGVELHHTNDVTWHHMTSRDVIGAIWGVGCVIQGGSVMESYQFEILDQYFSVIVTIPHTSIESQSLCIPTYFSVYLKPWEVIIMHKIYLKTFLLADDSVRCRDVTRSWPVPSLIFEFDIQGWRDRTSCWPSNQSNFRIWQAFNSIHRHPTLNLRPALNSVAFSTYIVKFSALKLVSFMAYTYNIQGWRDGTRRRPRWPGPVTAPCHSLTATLTLSTFNLISINYANVWLHTLNVVEGFNMNCIKIYSIILSVTCHSLRNFPPLIHIPLYPFMNFQNPASYYFLS